MDDSRRRILGYMAGAVAVGTTGCIWGNDEPEEDDDDEETGVETPDGSEESDIFEEEDDDDEVEAPDVEEDGEAPEGEPAAVVEEYYEALDQRDFERANELIHPEGSTEHGQVVLPEDVPDEILNLAVTESETVEQESHAAAVEFVLESSADFEGRTIDETYEGIMGLQALDGEWRIREEETTLVDSPTMR